MDHSHTLDLVAPYRALCARWIVLSIILGGVPCVAVGQKAGAELAHAKAAMSHGISAVQRGDLAQARLEFSRVVTLAPQIEPGHAALGSVLLALDENDAALRELQLAHDLAPGDLTVDLNLGRVDLALGRYTDSVRSFRDCRASLTCPRFSVKETLAYATALAQTDQFSTALDVLQHAVTESPESALLNDGLGTLLAQSGQIDQARPYFERAVSLDSGLGQAQLHLATALLTLNRAEQALVPSQMAVAQLPGDFNAELQLGRVLSALHRDQLALTYLHRAAALKSASQPADALYALALALQSSGDPQGAIPMFAAALSPPASGGTFPRNSALINYALARVQTGDADGALPLYIEALAAGPDSATLREDFGAAYLQKADLEDASMQFRAGLALEPENAHLHYDLGLAFKLKDNLSAAVPEFERAAQLDPNLPDPSYTLGVIYMQQGRYADAVLHLRRATDLQPSNGDAWALLGGVLKDSGDAAAAMDALHHAIDLQSDQPSLHIQLAALEAQAGKTVEAASERKIAADLSRVALSRQRAEFALKSGRTLLAQNKFADAVYQLSAAATADPTLAEPHLLLAQAYLHQGKAADAALERKQALALGANKNRP